MRFKQRDMNFDILLIDENKIFAETSTNNYMKLSNWCDDDSAYQHEFDLNVGSTIKIHGIILIDYIFKQYCIEAIFSFYFIQGNLELFKKQELRKEKLKKLRKNIS